jgi:hypothetical protein
MVFRNPFLKESITSRFQAALLVVGYAVTSLQFVQILTELNFQRQFIFLLLLLLSPNGSTLFTCSAEL